MTYYTYVRNMEKFNGDIRRYESIAPAKLFSNKSFQRLIFANLFVYFKF